MSDKQHPITPPPELAIQWSIESEREHQPTVACSLVSLLATQAARWGADMELEACTTWLLLNGWGQAINGLRAARRPKPSSLKEQSIALIDKIQYKKEMWQTDDLDVVRRALESLPD